MANFLNFIKSLSNSIFYLWLLFHHHQEFMTQQREEQTCVSFLIFMKYTNPFIYMAIIFGITTGKSFRFSIHRIIQWLTTILSERWCPTPSEGRVLILSHGLKVYITHKQALLKHQGYRVGRYKVRLRLRFRLLVFLGCRLRLRLRLPGFLQLQLWLLKVVILV